MGLNVSQSGGAGIANVPVANTLYVDAINGNDATGQRGQVTYPFKTLTAAKTAALSGDLIEVFPGVFNEGDLLKDQVNWYFHAGAKIILTTTNGVNDVIWSDYAGAVKSIINGFGEFSIETSIASQLVIDIENAASNVYISCQSVNTTGTGGYAVYFATAVDKCYAKIQNVTSTAVAPGVSVRLSVGASIGEFGKVVSSGRIYMVTEAPTAKLSIQYAQDGGTSPASVGFSAGGGVWNLGVFNSINAFTLQCNSGNATFNIDQITATGQVFFNLINATNYFNINRITGGSFICQSTGGAAEDKIVIGQVIATTQLRFDLAAGKGVDYRVGRAWCKAGMANVRIQKAPELSYINITDMRGLSGTDPQTTGKTGMIYVYNNSNVKNVVIGGSYRLLGAYANDYPLYIQGTNNDIKLENGVTLVAGVSTTESIYASAAQALKVHGTVVSNVSANGNITLTYGTQITNSAVD